MRKIQKLVIGVKIELTLLSPPSVRPVGSTCAVALSLLCYATSISISRSRNSSSLPVGAELLVGVVSSSLRRHPSSSPNEHRHPSQALQSFVFLGKLPVCSISHRKTCIFVVSFDMIRYWTTITVCNLHHCS